jgi:hypothetical protein
MNKIDSKKDKLRFIVLPFTPKSDEPFDCVGLTLHFLLGNTIVLHTNLKEFWFGWRVKQLFPQKEKVEAYCQGKGAQLNLRQLSPEQGIRFWLYGQWMIIKLTCRYSTVWKMIKLIRRLSFFPQKIIS